MPTSPEVPRAEQAQDRAEDLRKQERMARSAWLALGFALFLFLFLFHIHPRPLIAAAIGGFLLFWAFWMVRRPKPKAEPRPEPGARS